MMAMLLLTEPAMRYTGLGCRPAVTSYIQGRTRSDLSCKSPNQDAGKQHNESTLGTQTVLVHFPGQEPVEAN
jgi:hypothetical protein